jgi:hypothetical protein
MEIDLDEQLKQIRKEWEQEMKEWEQEMEEIIE